MNNLPKTAPIKAYSKKQVCTMYGVTPSTLRAWFKRSNLHYDKNIRIFTPIVVGKIFETFGNPTYNEKGEEFNP